MSLPTVTVEVSFEANPMDAPVWVDISDYVRGWQTQRGRQQAFDRQEAGTGTLVLDNRDRRFDPTYAAGPYYGNIWPMRKVRIRATWASIVYDVFTGFVESWLPAWPNYGKDENISVDLVDGFKWLSLAKINTTFAEEKTDVRVTNVLDYCNWTAGANWVLDSTSNSQLGTTTILAPNGDRYIDGGQTTVQAAELADVFALQHLQDVVEAENGNIFVDKAGALVFHNRYRSFQWPYNNSIATFGEGAGELPYTDVLASFDDSLLANQVRITILGGSEQTASNATSSTKYGPRALVRTSQLMNTDAEALYAAQYLLSRYEELTDPLTGLPMLRFEKLLLNGQRDDDLWPQILGRELGDRITIKRQPAVGSVIAQQSNIIGISHTYKASARTWETEFALMPADTKQYWILDDSVLSVLGNTTRLMY